MDPQPILPSAIDLERRRLENTIDHDLHSLSLGSLITSSTSSHTIQGAPRRIPSPHHDTSSSSMTSMSSIEYPRAFGEGDTGRPLPFDLPRHTHTGIQGPHGTPRAAGRKVSGMSARSIRSEFDSPVSTANHHVSAVTLGEGIFRTARGMEDMSTDEFDPERSLGRLVGELGKVMGGISPRPTSPFAALSPPRSPSPFSSINGNAQNLSLTLNRNDPLPSPPSSRSGSRSSSASHNIAKETQQSNSRFTAMANDLGNDLRKRNALGETGRHNVQPVHAFGDTPARKNPAKEKERDRLRALQGNTTKRPASAPGRVMGDGDVTGMTGLMETPAKGGEFGGLDKNAQVGGDNGANIPQTLATLHARLRALETENSVSRRRVRELEVELEQARGEVDAAKQQGGGRLRDVIGEKTALEDLIKSLRNHLARLTAELEQSKSLVADLRNAQTAPAHLSPPRPSHSVRDELVSLRREVERLGNEVHRLGGIVEKGLDTRRRARGERTMRMEEAEAAHQTRQAQREEQDEDLIRIQEDVQRRERVPPTPAPPARAAPSRLRQGVHEAASQATRVMPPSAAPPTRTSAPSHRHPTPPASDDGHVSPTPTHGSRTRTRRSQVPVEQGPSSPFPSIRAEDEEDFFAALDETERDIPNIGPRKPTARNDYLRHARTKAPTSLGKDDDHDIPPQTVLARVIAELEADFAHYKAIYAELADQYKILDAASAVAKRRVLAEHLKEVIDTLEQKADQISELYSLLTYRDRKDHPGRPQQPSKVGRSVPDILRMVKESLGEEGLRRLEEDGVGLRRKHAAI